MQISCFEISVRYLKILIRRITNIDDILESIVVILVSRFSDTSDFLEPSDTNSQASDTGGPKTFAKAIHRLGSWSTKLTSRSH